MTDIRGAPSVHTRKFAARVVAGTSMASSINVPAQLQPVLREFTKAVLRDMPEDCIAYGKAYFTEKAAELRMETYQLPPSSSKPFAELPAHMQVDVENVFKRYDVDQDGALTLDELQTMMQDLGGLFGFEGEVDSSTLMALLDANGDGGISWQEWSHACAVWLAETRS